MSFTRELFENLFLKLEIVLVLVIKNKLVMRVRHS
jgi:hypothetical protein